MRTNGWFEGAQQAMYVGMLTLPGMALANGQSALELLGCTRDENASTTSKRNLG